MTGSALDAPILGWQTWTCFSSNTLPRPADVRVAKLASCEDAVYPVGFHISSKVCLGFLSYPIGSSTSRSSSLFGDFGGDCRDNGANGDMVTI